MIGGGETFAEDLFFYIAPQTYDRGYNFMTVDLPGQGLLPLEGKTFRPDMNVPMKAVVDYALSRPDVDPRQLGLLRIQRRRRLRAPGRHARPADQGDCHEFRRR